MLPCLKNWGGTGWHRGGDAYPVTQAQKHMNQFINLQA